MVGSVHAGLQSSIFLRSPHKKLFIIYSNSLLLINLSKMEVCGLLVHCVDGTGRWTGCYDLLVSCYVDCGPQSIHSQHAKESSENEIHELVCCHAQILLSKWRIQASLYDSICVNSE